MDDEQAWHQTPKNEPEKSHWKNLVSRPDRIPTMHRFFLATMTLHP